MRRPTACANNYYFANGVHVGCQGFNFINYLLIKCKFIKNWNMMRGDLGFQNYGCLKVHLEGFSSSIV